MRFKPGGSFLSLKLWFPVMGLPGEERGGTRGQGDLSGWFITMWVVVSPQPVSIPLLVRRQMHAVWRQMHAAAFRENSRRARVPHSGLQAQLFKGTGYPTRIHT